MEFLMFQHLLVSLTKSVYCHDATGGNRAEQVSPFSSVAANAQSPYREGPQQCLDRRALSRDRWSLSAVALLGAVASNGETEGSVAQRR